MPPLESLRQQLEFFTQVRRESKPSDWPYPFLCIEDLLLRHGSVFEPSPQRPPVSPIPRVCFQQSYRWTQRRRRWIYCEGFAMNNGVPFAVHHAWVIRDDAPTMAVDFAWEDGVIYLGIPFQREFVREMHLSSKRKYFSVLDTWWAHFPLLTGKIRLEDVIWPRR